MYSTSLRSIRDWIWGFITILARQHSLAFQLYGLQNYHHTWYTCVCRRIGNPSLMGLWHFLMGKPMGFTGSTLRIWMNLPNHHTCSFHYIMLPHHVYALFIQIIVASHVLHPISMRWKTSLETLVAGSMVLFSDLLVSYWRYVYTMEKGLYVRCNMICLNMYATHDIKWMSICKSPPSNGKYTKINQISRNFLFWSLIEGWNIYIYTHMCVSIYMYIDMFHPAMLLGQA